MIMNVAFIFIFCCPYEITIEDENECNVHYHLLQFQKKNIETQKRMKSLPTCHSPLQPKKKNLAVGFSWVARDDKEPPSLSLSLSFFSSLVEDDDEPTGSSLFLIFFPHLEKVMTS